MLRPLSEGLYSKAFIARKPLIKYPRHGEASKNPLAMPSNWTLITIQINGQMKRVAFEIFICRENFNFKSRSHCADQKICM